MRQPFDDVALFVRQLSPGFESSFFAARAKLSVTHIKLFFRVTVIYLELSSCNLAIDDAGKQVV